VVINELVCEGCGDCGVQSNCLSVEPLETEFGRKRRINQSTCNKDYSCVKGFCPSFVTVEGGSSRSPRRRRARATSPALPRIARAGAAAAEQAWGIVVAGVGGTGVITIGQLLGMAAHLEGKGVVTQDAGGLAQKGGATWSHMQIANRQDAIRTTKVDTAKADLVIGCDPSSAANKETLRMQPGPHLVALNTPRHAHGRVREERQLAVPRTCERPTLGQRRGRGAGVGSFDAEQVATQLLGDSIYTNPLMLGYAWQKGRVPLTTRVADARHGAQRRAGGEQQGRL
jgi:indolepyruvate ferredoxin oxidoreductase